MKISNAVRTGMFCLPLLIAPLAKSTPITGNANMAGNVTVSGTSISFNPIFTNTAGAMEAGSFSGLTSGVIQSLSGGPVTGATFLPNFVSFTSGVSAPIFFDLTYISPGVGTVAGCSSGATGSACTPAGSPFTLFQLANNTVVAVLQLNGNGYTGASTTGSTPTTSIFSTQTTGTVPQLYSMLLTGQSISGITYSASFAAVNPVPEPGSLLLVGFGLVGAGLLARRKPAA